MIRLLIDYRHFDAVSNQLSILDSLLLFCFDIFPYRRQKNIIPRFEFGFGLSYTSFRYTDLRIAGLKDLAGVQCNEITNWEAGNASKITEGSSTAFW
jgi:hypothetical protein